METIKFYSNNLKKLIQAEIVEKRKRTYKLKLSCGKVIIKKINQLEFENDN